MITREIKVLELNPTSQEAVHELLYLASCSDDFPPARLARLINSTNISFTDPEIAFRFFCRLLPELNVRFLTRETRDDDFACRARMVLTTLRRESELCRNRCDLLCLLAELHWYFEEQAEAEESFRRSLGVRDTYERAKVAFPRFLWQVTIVLEGAVVISA
eukprot:765260-Hanusia_phi.AAC.7